MTDPIDKDGVSMGDVLRSPVDGPYRGSSLPGL